MYAYTSLHLIFKLYYISISLSLFLNQFVFIYRSIYQSIEPHIYITLFSLCAYSMKINVRLADLYMSPFYALRQPFLLMFDATSPACTKIFESKERKDDFFFFHLIFPFISHAHSHARRHLTASLMITTSPFTTIMNIISTLGVSVATQ